MFNWSISKALLAQILFFMFIFLFTWSPISGECQCDALTCRCSNVTFVPRFDSNVTSIIIEDSTCYLYKEFMANLSNLALEELHFNRTKIRGSEKNFFQNFPYLKKLTFQSPSTSFDTLNHAFNSLYLTNISKLEISSLKIGSSLDRFLITLKGTNITELSLVRCYLTTFNSTSFLHFFKHLQYLDLSQNYIDQANWAHTNHLQVLKLKHSNLKLPAFLALNGTSFFPNLKHLEISVEQIEKVNSSTFEGLDNLKYLFFGTSSKTRISTSFLSLIPKLESLHIQGFDYIQIRLVVEYGAFRSEQLQYLKLEYFQIILENKGSFVRHIPNLLSLELILTRVFLLPSELTDELTPLKKLETFTMSFSALKKVPTVLCFMTNLTRIDLGQNHITFWNSTNCPVMSRLKFLSLTQNEIQLIERNTFSHQLIANDQLFWDLSGNLFLCNCRLVWFMNWSLQIRNRLRFYPKYYKCETPPELKGKLFNSTLYSDEQCSTGNSLLIIVFVPFGSLILIFTVIASVLYYKRWNIRYLLYLVRSRRKQKKEQEGIRNYSFDAFVCYHNSNIDWLLKELRPKLEEENNFSLCIHDRDFVAGWDIVENIVESIEKSRKVLLLLSNEFLCSHWCRFEMNMAHQRVIEMDENLLILVLLEDIDISKQSRRLSLLLRQKTYLEWTDNKEGQALFWQRLISCLRATNVQEV